MRPLQMFALFCLVTAATLGHAQDVKGGKDHPLISRYTDSQLIAWHAVPYAEIKPFTMLTDDIAQKKKLRRDFAVEGELTELYYQSPKGRTALEVQRNYEAALKQAGAVLMHSCSDVDWGCYRGGGPAGEALLNGVVPYSQQIGSYSTYEAFSAFSNNLRLAVFRWSRGGADTYITVYSVDIPTDIKTFGGRATTALQIVEPKVMDTGKVAVFDVAKIASGLRTEGKVSLYGIYFDTGKSDVKPESKAQLDEMGDFLKHNSALKVFIVGHTDNQGAYEANVTLSQRRAEAVVAALVKDYRIDAKRLAAKGAANISPVVSNSSEAGRAKNRRVELVEQ